MKDETMDMFLESLSEIRLKAYKPLIDYGALDSNVYFVKSGIIRLAYFNGFREITHAFAPPGSMVTSYYPYYMGEPSFVKLEACSNSVVMKISRNRFLELTRQSHDFAQWVMSMFTAQLWAYEKKLAVVNGDARERFEALMKNRPEIMKKVPMKYIAAYLGITPQYLCKLKRLHKNKQEK